MMHGLDDIDSLASEIVGEGAASSTKKEPEKSGLEAGAPSTPADEDPGEIAATEAVMAAFQSGDASALNQALKDHYTIVFGHSSPGALKK